MHEIEDIIKEFFSLWVVIQLVELKRKKNKVENVKPYNDKKRELTMRKNVVKNKIDTAYTMGLISI